jgi:hypothetical protein
MVLGLYMFLKAVLAENRQTNGKAIRGCLLVFLAG